MHPRKQSMFSGFPGFPGFPMFLESLESLETGVRQGKYLEVSKLRVA